MRFADATAVLGVLLVLPGCTDVPDVETRPSQYEALLAEWRSSGLVSHFPNRIPANAENVRFSAYPGFLQGGAWMQVRFELPTVEVKRIYQEATKTALQFHDGGDAVTLLNARDDGLWSTSFHTSSGSDFPPDYRVFVLDAVPYKSGTGHDWNHGESKGIVVSRVRNEVIYFAEDW